VRYCAGVLLLDRHDPRRVLHRSTHSVLQPQLAAEREGVVPEVVFPTGLDVQPDGALDVYYGMADSRIGVARTRCGMVPAPAPAWRPTAKGGLHNLTESLALDVAWLARGCASTASHWT
jgi:hypothetical protein